MYLYFDKNGVLKEIINDKALRQGNYGVNTIYVYVEDKTYDSIDASFLLPSGVVVGPYYCGTFTDGIIPYDPKRDLRFFKYGKTYKFCEIPLDNYESPTSTHNPLEEAGAVHASLTMIIDGNQDVLGEVNFYVEMSTVPNQPQVAPEEYMSLANYEYLRKLAQNVGASILTGSGEPPANIGNNGDVYLDTDDYDLYKKSADTWNLIGNIQGPQGETGAEGPRGPQGETGGFGTPTATASQLPSGSLPSVTVTIDPSSPDTAKIFQFSFGIPRGADGVISQDIGVVGFQVDSSGRLVASMPGSADPSASLSINSSGQLVYTY